MRRNGSSLLAVIAVAVTLVGARRAPMHAVLQATDACWFRPPPAQGEAEKRKSAHDSASVAMEGGTVKVCYGRPRVNGREIMGKLVPYGEPWRLGADEATALYVPFRASIAGVKVEPGWYSIYVIPTAKEWQVVVNSDAKRWGVDIDAKVRAKDVGTGTVPAEHLAAPVEEMTIALAAGSPRSATMDVTWADTHVRIPIEKR
jgi:Protein of unknown function (DUF2911)